MLVPNKPKGAVRLLAFSDWRIQDYTDLVRFLDGCEGTVDVLVYAGDDLRRLDSGTSQSLVEALAGRVRSRRFLFVGGNDDDPGLVRIVSDRPAWHNLHQAPFFFRGFAFFGVEGTTNGIGPLQHSEREVERVLAAHMKRLARHGRLRIKHQPVVVSHAPPRNVLDLAIRFSPQGEAIGSVSLRTFLDQHRVPLTVCGHVHLFGGRTEMLSNGNQVLNIASNDQPGAEGRIAIADLLPRGKVDVHLLSTETLYAEHELMGLSEVGPRRVRCLIERGIAGLADVTVRNEHRLQVAGVGYALIDRWIRQARMIRRRASGFEILKPGPLAFLEHDHHVVWDIETSVGGGVIWLIGAHDMRTGEVVQFFDPVDERRCIREFLDWMTRRQTAIPVSYSAIGFDARILKNSARRLGLRDRAGVATRDVDLGKAIRYDCVSRSKRVALKHLAREMGFRFRHPGLDGLAVGLAFNRFQCGLEVPDWKRLREYNADDVRATAFLLKTLQRSYARYLRKHRT